MVDTAIPGQGQRFTLDSVGTPRPRSIEGTPPVRVLTGAERDNPDEVRREPVGRPHGGRKSSAGRRCPSKRKPAAERQRESITGWIGRIAHAERRPTWDRATDRRTRRTRSNTDAS